MKKAPFKNGDKLKYIGKQKVSSGINGEEMKPLYFDGMVVKIIKVVKPIKGLGMVEYYGEQIEDYDQDGYNVFENEFGNGACISDDEYLNDWELI